MSIWPSPVVCDVCGTNWDGKERHSWATLRHREIGVLITLGIALDRDAKHVCGDRCLGVLVRTMGRDGALEVAPRARLLASSS